jgi:methyltransferase
MAMSNSEVLFLGLLSLIAFERLFELRLSQKNAAEIREKGGQEWGAGHFPVMVFLHTALFPSAWAEVHFLHRPWHPLWAWAMGLLILATMLLRYWAIRSLGPHWNTRVIVLPGAQLVQQGPYRWIRHPNYLAVIVELVAIPLFHGAWWTATGFGLANIALLRHRIRVEEQAMASLCKGAESMAQKPRFL